VSSICYLTENLYALGLAGNGNILLFDLQTRQITATIKSPLRSVSCLAHDRSGKIYAGGKGSTEIYAISLSSLSITEKWRPAVSEAEPVCLSIDKRLNWLAAVSVSPSNYKSFLSFCCLKEFPIADSSVESQATVLTGVAFRDDSTMLLSCFGPGQLQAKLDGHLLPFPNVSFSGASGFLVSRHFAVLYGVDGILLIGDASTLKLL